MDAERDHYATLGIEPSADAPSIRAAYRALAQRYHPDKADESDAEAVSRMVEINAAYHVLGDPGRRRQYDRQRQPQAQPQPHGPAGPAPAEQPTETTEAPPAPRRHPHGSRLRGTNARRYARRHGLTTEDVIDMIRCGDLPGFKRRGTYYVMPAWRRETVTGGGGDPAGCLLAAIIVLILVLAVVILFVEEWPATELPDCCLGEPDANAPGDRTEPQPGLDDGLNHSSPSSP